MRNMLLVAGPVTDPKRFMLELGRHPDVAALPPVTLSNALHAVARRAVYAAANSDRSGTALMTLAREEGGAALASYFTSLREATGKPVVVLHDPSGPLFPFMNPPGIDLLVLTRDPESAAVTAGAGGIPRVIEAARTALEGFERRLEAFGMSPDRVHRIDEERLRRDPRPVWSQLCATLGVDAGEQAVAALARPTIEPWSLGSGQA